MAHALRAWAINRGGKNSVRNLRYGPRTRFVTGIYSVQKHFGCRKAQKKAQFRDRSIENAMEK